MKETVGVIGSNGDLGSQLVRRLEAADFDVLSYDINSPDSDRSLQEIKAGAEIVHLTVPSVALPEYGQLRTRNHGVTILHDSVMHVSNAANRAYFSGRASVAHMLMNKQDKVVVAQGTSSEDKVVAHFADIGMDPVVMPASKHDEIMAMSQAPLALLCEMIHFPLQKYLADGLLTPSGSELAAALTARAASWTPSTIGSLLQNPHLHKLMKEMRDALDEVPPGIPYDSDIKERMEAMGIVDIPNDPRAAQLAFNKLNRNRLRIGIDSEPDDEKRRAMSEYARERYPLPGDSVI